MMKLKNIKSDPFGILESTKRVLDKAQFVKLGKRKNS